MSFLDPTKKEMKEWLKKELKKTEDKLKKERAYYRQRLKELGEWEE